MKPVSLAVEGLTLDRLLQEAASGDVIFLTANGRICFVLASADEGDAEACAMRSNAELMAYLTQCTERAKSGPRKTIQQIRSLYHSEAPQTNQSPEPEER